MEIRAKEVRLVDEKGQMLGVVTLSEALARAAQVGLDLVEISPQADIPVCKILDFGKFKYEAKKKAHEAKKKQKVITVKEIKFRPNIGQNDFDIKVKHIIEFLKNGDKVKVTLWFKGREIVHNQLGFDLLEKVKNIAADYSKVEVQPKMEGKLMMMMLAPK